MDEALFQSFLKKGGRSPSAVQRCLALTLAFDHYLRTQQPGLHVDTASPADLESYAAYVESTPQTSAKAHLWALAYYYQFRSNDEMESAARALRSQRIKRTPFGLSKFRGVNPEHVAALAGHGIRYADQILKAGKTATDRHGLASRTGVPLAAIDELVQLSDLARIPGMKAVRTRLYFDAGIKMVVQLAAWDPQQLCRMLRTFVQETGFDGIAPLPKEVDYSVTAAKSLPILIEY